MAIKADSGIALKTFITYLGAPEPLTIEIYKDHSALVTEFIEGFQRNDVQITRTEPEPQRLK